MNFAISLAQPGRRPTDSLASVREPPGGHSGDEAVAGHEFMLRTAKTVMLDEGWTQELILRVMPRSGRRKKPQWLSTRNHQ